MGNCRCELHVHQNESEAVYDNRGSQGISSNRPLEIVSQYSQLSGKDKGIKLNKMKNNLLQKIPEIGNTILINDYKKVINEDINNYMANNKLNIKKYIHPNISTVQSDPIKFKNNNNIYYGNWNDKNQMEGYGIYYIEDRKIVTEGIWHEGNIIYGRIFFPNGDIYEGEMKNSLPDGKGKISYSNGEIYEGDFKQGEMTGKGIYTFSDRTQYIGDMEKGFFKGYGKMKWNNGTEYTGSFSESTLNGKGIIINMQNEKYDGMFEKNEFNGKGTYYYNNGDKYDGNFEYGIKRGNGKFVRKFDNVEFDGNWNDDLPNGNGIITFKKSNIKGFWRNGVFIGSENEEENNNEDLNNIDKDIKPDKINIIPNSLPHLAITDSNNASQFIPGNFV